LFALEPKRHKANFLSSLRHSVHGRILSAAWLGVNVQPA
jgi:hypothetical protein